MASSTSTSKPMGQHACKMDLEGIVSKRKTSSYRSPQWLKSKNPACAVAREAEKGWGRPWR